MKNLKRKNAAKSVEEMYRNVNTRSVELLFGATGPYKSIGQRTPVFELIKELEEEGNELPLSQADEGY